MIEEEKDMKIKAQILIKAEMLIGISAFNFILAF